jgi:hypothetical protein
VELALRLVVNDQHGDPMPDNLVKLDWSVDGNIGAFKFPDRSGQFCGGAYMSCMTPLYLMTNQWGIAGGDNLSGFTNFVQNRPGNVGGYYTLNLTYTVTNDYGDDVVKTWKIAILGMGGSYTCQYDEFDQRECA